MGSFPGCTIVFITCQRKERIDYLFRKSVDDTLGYTTLVSTMASYRTQKRK